MRSPPTARLPLQLQSAADVLENIADGFFALDRLWRFTYVNKTVCTLLQKSPNELLDGDFRVYFPPLVCSELGSQLELACRTETVISFETFCTFTNLWLAFNVHPFDDGIAVYIRDVTDRHESMAAIRASESRFRSMVENLPAGAVLREGDLLWINSAIERLTGYQQIEIQTVDDWFARLHPSEDGAARARYEQFRKSGFPAPQGSTLTCKDGTTRHVEFTAYLHGADEIWLVHDVSGRLMTEQKFKVLFENSSSAYFLFDRNGVADCNAAALKQLKLADKNDVIGKSFSDLSPEIQADDTLSRDRLVEVNRDLNATGQSTFEWTHFRSDGSCAQVFVSASKFKIGEETMELVVWQDLTFIRDAEEKLRQSEIHYQQIVDNTDEIIYTLSLEGRFTFVSPSWTRHLGHTPEEVKGRRFIEFVHPDDRAIGAAYTKRLFNDPNHRDSCEYRALHKDKSYRWHETSGSLVMDKSDKPLHFVGLTHDVSERLRVRAELEQALEAAETASRAKSQFLATVSHEIRTPLNGVLGMTTLLADTDLAPEQMAFVKTIQSSGEMLRRVIDDVLDYSRIEAGKLSISPLNIDVVSTIEDVVSLFQGSAHEKGIALGLDWGGIKTLPVFADPARIKQVVANLVGNAVKFTESGGVRVSARIQPSEGTAVNLYIEVQDSGIGIPPEQAEAIFEGFTQADSSMHRKYGGSGLGLTISKRLVDLMDGKIGVESTPGNGSRFWVELSLSKVTTALLRPIIVQSNVSLDGIRILLAEDNEINIEVARRQIERLGCIVTVAQNGLEAIQMTAENTYDIVLMDVQMPEVDGLQATRQIRARELGTSERLPIIALTATAFAEDQKACEKAGMDGFLPKPFRLDELESLLKIWASEIKRKPEYGATDTA